MTVQPTTRPRLDFHPNSYIDPLARVFRLEGQYFRGFFPKQADFFRQLLQNQEVTRLQDQGKLIGCQVVEDLDLPEFGLVVKHPLVQTLSFCFEWPMAMLKRAALLTLEIAQSFCPHGVTLQDATSYNVFFQGTRPIFIDLSSLAPDGSSLLWPAYGQFCQFFLFPLYLHAAGKSSAALKLLANSPNGLEGPEVAALLGPLDKLRLKGYLSRLALPEFMARHFASLRDRSKMGDKSSELAQRVDLPAARGRFLASLQKTVQAINAPPKPGNWTDYYRETDEQVLARKMSLVERVFEESRPAQVVDVGCNLGEFSLLAARHQASVIALDSDHDCVNRLYQLAEQEGAEVLPLVVDALNPSPDLGWLNREYPSLLKRVKGDMVLALALLHHFIFSGGQDFPRSVQALKAYQAGSLLIEYVDQGDPMTNKLPRRPGVDYAWYNERVFLQTLEDEYAKVELLERLSPTRSLYLAA